MNQAKVLALVGEQDGCFLWRVALPFAELQRQGYQGVEWGAREDDRLALIAHQFDAIILPRLHWPTAEQDKAERWFKALRQAGLAIIYEMDDDLFSDDFEKRLRDHKGYDGATARERRGCILDTIRMCDGLTVSSQRLATMARQYVNLPIHVVPNFIDLRWFKKIQKAYPRKVEGLTIGWAGGARPDSDLEQMAIAWGELAKKYPQVTFVVQGHHAKPLYQHVPNARIAMLDWLPIDHYPAGMLNIDIGCCPLSDTPFNRAKTYIKALEFAALGAPVVASPTVYKQIIEHGVNGYLAETVEDWLEYLSRLIEDYTHRKQIAKALLAKVRSQHSLEKNAWRWLVAWETLIEKARAVHPRPRILLPEGVKVNYEYAV